MTVNLAHARTDDQLEVMKEIAKSGKCPFCPEQLQRWHKESILKETLFWTLTFNQWPREGARVHLLAIYRFHATDLDDVPSAAMSELHQLLAWAKGEFNVRGGMLFMRFGDSKFSGASVEHLHVQFIGPQEGKNVRFKVGS